MACSFRRGGTIQSTAFTVLMLAFTGPGFQPLPVSEPPPLLLNREPRLKLHGLRVG